MFSVSGQRLNSSSREPSYASEVCDYRFELDLNSSSSLPLNKVNSIVLRVAHRFGGQPVRLEKVMGTYAHMVAFDPAGKGFAHMHPIDEGSGIGTEEARFSFSVRTDLPGLYRVWAQLKAEGTELFAPFDVRFGNKP